MEREACKSTERAEGIGGLHKGEDGAPQQLPDRRTSPNGRATTV